MSVNPNATVVDISHDVRPQDIQQGAFLLSCAYGFFPPGSIHVVVVDPDVGTERLGLAIAAGGFMFVGPDNGVLSAAIPDPAREAASGTRSESLVPDDVRAYSLANSHYHRRPVSPTFHARDIFGPVAAHLSLNVEISELGPAVSEVSSLCRRFEQNPRQTARSWDALSTSTASAT